MAFWALGALDKVKNMGIGNVTKKLKNYVNVSPEKGEQLTSKPTSEDIILPKPEKKRLTQEELMQVQLVQYKKLLALEQRLLEEHARKEQEEIQRRSRQLMEVNKALVETEAEERKNRERDNILRAIESGEKTIDQIIEQNILYKERLILTSKQ